MQEFSVFAIVFAILAMSGGLGESTRPDAETQSVAQLLEAQ